MAWLDRWRQPTEETPKEEESAPPPEYVSKEEYNALKDQFTTTNQQLGQLSAYLQGYVAPQGQPAAAPQIDDITEEEYQEALQSGDAVALEKRRKADEARLKAEIDQREAALKQQGEFIFSHVNNRDVQQMSNKLPYYESFKKEIEEQLGRMHPTQRTPEAVKLLYDMQVGQNIEKVTVWERERVAREEAAQGADITRTGRGKSRPTNTFSEVFGDRYVNQNASLPMGGRVWSHRHSNPNEFASLITEGRITDANKYAQDAQNIMNTEDCRTCWRPAWPGHKCDVATGARRG